ncbi:MAG: TolC family protein [Muribaculaceae bacterium]|nr:TolC family protein [Muribaculaceae bacterium]
MRKVIVALVLPLLAVNISAQAEADFDGVVDRVMESLTNVLTVNNGLDARIMGLAAENTLPGPEVGFEYKFPQQRGVGNRWGLEVSQGFDWPGIYRARRDAAEGLRDLRGRVSASAYRRLRCEVEDRVMQVIEARKRVAILEVVERNLAEVSEKSEHMLNLGQITVLDRRKAEFELLAIKEKLTDARAELDRLTATVGFGQVIPDGLDRLTDFPARLTAAPISTAEEIELETEIVGEMSNARVENLKKLPSFSLGYVHDFEEGIHFNGFSVGVNLPSYGAGKSATAARLEAETAMMKLNEARAERQAELKNNAAELVRLESLLADYDRAIGGDDYLRLLKKSFDARQITLTQYILDQNWYLNARLDHLALQLRYHRLLPLANPVSE